MPIRPIVCSSDLKRGCPWLWMIGVVLPAVLLIGSCATAERSGLPGTPAAQRSEWRAGQVLDASQQAAVPTEEWKASLSGYDVIFLGEEHHNRHHVQAAIEVIRALLRQGRHPIVAMEMFGWDGQAALDEYVASQLSRDQFVERVGWKENWGGPFEDYEPLVQVAKERGLPLLAVNPPKTLIKQVVHTGLAGVRTQAVWARWGMQNEIILDDEAYRKRILTQLRDCHGGGSPEDYRTMYEASLVRDEGMARTLAASLRNIRSAADPQAGPIVSYTGGGHIQYKLPVPNRLARRTENGSRFVTVYLTAFEPGRESELREMMRDGIADYIWLTPMGSQGPPRRCR